MSGPAQSYDTVAKTLRRADLQGRLEAAEYQLEIALRRSDTKRMWEESSHWRGEIAKLKQQLEELDNA